MDLKTCLSRYHSGVDRDRWRPLLTIRLYETEGMSASHGGVRYYLDDERNLREEDDGPRPRAAQQ